MLGPLLWNLGFNSVLETAVPTGLQLICYVDDTLITAGGRTWTRTLRLVEVGVAVVIAEIRRIGLEVAAQETEAMWIHDLPRSRRPPQTWMNIDEERILVKDSLKYLRITLDGRLNYQAHFDNIAPKMEGVAAHLGRLPPNIGGPAVKVRRLYASVIRSMIMNGSPIWEALPVKATKLYAAYREG